MKKLYIILMFAFLVSLASASALVLQSGSNYTYDNVVFTIGDDVTLDQIEMQSDTMIWTYQGVEHNIKIIGTGNIFVNVNFWAGLNHSFNITTDTPQTMTFNILVDGTPYELLNEGEFFDNNFIINQTSQEWIYTLPAPSNPTTGGGGGSGSFSTITGAVVDESSVSVPSLSKVDYFNDIFVQIEYLTRESDSGIVDGKSITFTFFGWWLTVFLLFSLIVYFFYDNREYFVDKNSGVDILGYGRKEDKRK